MSSPKIEKKSFSAPDETRPFAEKGKVEIITLNGVTFGRATFEPGWTWAKGVGPIAGTPSCQCAHLAYQVAGRMRIVMDDGSETVIEPGDVYSVPPGHHTEVLGDEPVVALDITGMDGYARPV